MAAKGRVPCDSVHFRFKSGPSESMLLKVKPHCDCPGGDTGGASGVPVVLLSLGAGCGAVFIL